MWQSPSRAPNHFLRAKTYPPGHIVRLLKHYIPAVIRCGHSLASREPVEAIPWRSAVDRHISSP
jgi:hypothetical protein